MNMLSKILLLLHSTNHDVHAIHLWHPDIEGYQAGTNEENSLSSVGRVERSPNNEVDEFEDTEEVIVPEDNSSWAESVDPGSLERETLSDPGVESHRRWVG